MDNTGGATLTIKNAKEVSDAMFRIIFQDMMDEIQQLEKAGDEMCILLERRVVNGGDRARVIQAWRNRQK